MTKTIGVVDDDDSWRKTIRRSLERESAYSVRTFSSPYEVLSAYRELDGISTDGRMPNKGDGLNLAKKLRDNGYSGPIIMVSGTLPTDSELKQAGIDYGVEKDNTTGVFGLSAEFARLFTEREKK